VSNPQKYEKSYSEAMDITLYMTIIEEDSKANAAPNEAPGGETSSKENDVSLDNKEKEL
jgi:hypothetical protein